MVFDLAPFDYQCFIDDQAWKMIIESGTFCNIGKWNYTIYKRHVITFKIDKGNVILLKRRKIPCANYKLPILMSKMDFKERCSVYKERNRIEKGFELDDENYKIYSKAI